MTDVRPCPKHCPQCGRQWNRIKHLPSYHTRCTACATRILEGQTPPYEQWTDEMKAQAERNAAVLWPK